MSKGDESSSDRRTVVFLVVLCILFVLLIFGAIFFLYTVLAPTLASTHTSSPTPTPAPAATASPSGVVNNPGIAGTGNVALPAGAVPLAGPVVYVGEMNTGAVVALDAVSGRTLGKIRTEAGNCGMAVTADGSRIYINNGSDIIVVNAWTNQVVGRIRTSSPTTGNLVLSPDKAHLFVVGFYGLSIISLYGDMGDEIAYVQGINATTARGIGVGRDLNYLFATDWYHCVLQVVNISAGRIEDTIDLVPDDYPQGYITMGDIEVRQAGRAEGIAFSPDGRRATVGIQGGHYVAVVDLQSRRLEKAVQLNGSSFPGVAYSRDGKYVYVTDYDGKKIRALDSVSFTTVSSFNVTIPPRNIAIDREGKYMCIADDTASAEIVGLPGGNLVRALGVTAAIGGSCIAFNPKILGFFDTNFTGQTVYICRNGTDRVTVYNTSTGYINGDISVANVASGVAVSHDGNYVYISDGNEIAVGNARTNSFDNYIPISHRTTGYLITSPDDRYLYVVCDGGLAVIELSPSSGREAGFITGVTAMGIGISPDGKYVYTTDWGNCMLQVINTRERWIENTIDLIPASAYHGTVSWQGMQVKAAGQAVGLAVSPDGRHAVIGIWAGSFIPVVDLQNQTLEKAIPVSSVSHQCVAFSQDGKRVYVSNYDGDSIIVLDGATFTPIGTIDTAPDPKNIAVSPDGKYLYVAHEEANVEVISLSEGGRVRTLNIQAGKSGQNIAFNPAAA